MDRAAGANALGGLPVVEAHGVQLGRGPAQTVIVQARGRDVALRRVSQTPLFTGTVLPHPDWCVFFAPVAWEGEFRFNGAECAEEDVFLSLSDAGYATRGSKRTTHALAVRKSALRETCAALAGAPDLDPLRGDVRLTFKSASGDSLRRGIEQVFRGLAARPAREGRSGLTPRIEADLIQRCAHVVLEQTLARRVRDAGRRDPVAIVRRAKDVVASGIDQTVTLAAMCEAAGVGKAWLHKCFEDVHGVSPLGYVSARRLTVARDWLLDPDAPPRSVKDVALSLGFMNGGRFAQRYALVHGERPSETLARNPAFRDLIASRRRRP